MYGSYNGYLGIGTARQQGHRQDLLGRDQETREDCRVHKTSTGTVAHQCFVCKLFNFWINFKGRRQQGEYPGDGLQGWNGEQFYRESLLAERVAEVWLGPLLNMLLVVKRDFSTQNGSLEANLWLRGPFSFTIGDARLLFC